MSLKALKKYLFIYLFITYILLLLCEYFYIYV